MSEGRERAMAGEEVPSSSTSSSFVWDDHSQLYYHAGTGFYHDPDAGWYYSSRDGAYYRFENGNYVALDTPDVGPIAESGDGQIEEAGRDETDRSGHGETYPASAVEDGEACTGNVGLECVRPPSEWLEETLINLYLMGHSKLEPDEDNNLPVNPQDGERSIGNTSVSDLNKFSTCHAGSELVEVEEKQLIFDDRQPSIEDLHDDCVDEENWKAQFGQVVKLQDEDAPSVRVIDLWDWSIVPEADKHQEVRLVGRLVGQSTKLHPSLSAVGLLKTAKISEVHLDLVRVATGKVYRLRNPSSGYLASLSLYDASNPTKNWGFPIIDFCSLQDKNALGISNDDGLSVCHQLTLAPGKTMNSHYRDRAAERRSLHGGYGTGPGQKKQRISEEAGESMLLSETEAINMSCGPGSYSRRILERMGWKEGEALGRRKGGLLEPLQAVGNRGSMGLGWNATREV